MPSTNWNLCVQASPGDFYGLPRNTGTVTLKRDRGRCRLSRLATPAQSLRNGGDAELEAAIKPVLGLDGRFPPAVPKRPGSARCGPGLGGRPRRKARWPSGSTPSPGRPPEFVDASARQAQAYEASSPAQARCRRATTHDLLNASSGVPSPRSSRGSMRTPRPWPVTAFAVNAARCGITLTLFDRFGACWPKCPAELAAAWRSA